MRRGAALLVALAVLLPLAACEQEGARPTATVSSADTADQVMEGFTTYVTSRGVRRARIDADTAYMFYPTRTMVLHNVRGTFYDQAGKDASTLVARRATYRTVEGSMSAEGQVEVRSTDGKVLRSEKLDYDKNADRISTDQPFTYVNGAERLEGTGFTADPSFKNVVADRPRGTAGGEMVLPGQ